ncbi:type VI secretion system baseplate subunit TssG [Rhodopila sp.]|jgi:type VI secretion system protein ImpH|uniref:type VI secretion system baseplate subunit TssG n=1 Tax=Rhodopila sp. TaxID=2480087 RepID=UPI002B883AA9|nr:type VI secretion system baseplate subunit TssG [Rhodopila sp.]HVZ09630.1 type VI secretion system baseplate subunit TssG [Rhodopila sp.]
MSPLERLASEPERFDFDAAIRVLIHAAHQPDPADIVRFRSLARLAYPASDVTALRPQGAELPPELVVSVMGLTGPSGVLPRGYAEVLHEALRARSGALHEFLDMLSHRMVALLARAGGKYRPARMAETSALAGQDADPLGQALLSLAGFGTPHLLPRLAAGMSPVMHYAGLLSAHPRSADRLQALVSDWLGRPVEIRQFAGAWVELPPDQRSRLPTGRRAGRFNRLGPPPEEELGPGTPGERQDATLGLRTWDVQAGIVLRIGPLTRAGFAELLPHRPTLPRLAALVRTYLNFATGFAINLVVTAGEVPLLRLGGDSEDAPLLGWNTWLCPPGGKRKADAADPLFSAEAIEARAAAAGHGR